jgi:Tfp pilus assembly protein PilF
MSDEQRRADAVRMWEKGYRYQMRQEVEAAIDAYRSSISLYPTAEAHTFLGWALSWKGDVDAAIDECKRAIEVDPEFGNPYNDIGAYLIELNKPEEAIAWLERAKRATRYDPRHFPYLNLGRVFTKLGQVTRAIREYEAALDLAPHDTFAKDALDKLRQLN